MAENSPIEWTDHTWSPWEGCTKVSPGCDHCYAEGMNRWLRKGENWGLGAPRREYSDEHWAKPLKWNAAAAKTGTRPKVFPSVCDPFDKDAPDGGRARFALVILGTPHLIWLLLTKRIGNAASMLAEMFPDGIPPNVWLGATVVNQEEADRDILKLLATPARVRFLSMEPLLGAVNLRLPTRTWTNSGGGVLCDHCCNGDRCDDPTHRERQFCPYCRGTGRGRPIDWVIVGGESGPHARPMHPTWARSLRDQCEAASVRFLFKQWGEWAPHPPTPGFDEGGALRRGLVRYLQGDGREPDGHFRRGDAAVIRSGKKTAGRVLDGRTHDEFPEVTCS